jgi:hypothetical protein
MLDTAQHAPTRATQHARLQANGETGATGLEPALYPRDSKAGRTSVKKLRP